MRFVKAEAYGNDFLFVTAPEAEGRDPGQLARTLCERHTGAGADGLIIYRLTPTGAAMRLLNADGSDAEVSGNGVRCLAALVLEERGVDATTDLRLIDPIDVETDAGSKQLRLLRATGGEFELRAAMGQPTGLRALDLNADGTPVRVVALRVGNPQCVVLGTPVTEARLHRLGPVLERHAAFPGGTNVELAEVAAPGRVRILIWERGVGPTRASGTGACAAAVAAASYGGASRDLEVESPGGTQRVEWLSHGLYLTGTARITFHGEWMG